MTPNEITEAYFKARGWWERTDGFNLGWYKPDGSYFGFPLPNILESFSAFKKHVLEVMGEEGFEFSVTRCLENISQDWIYSATWSKVPVTGENNFHKEPIKSNNIPHAAVIAATRYFEGKK